MAMFVPLIAAYASGAMAAVAAGTATMAAYASVAGAVLSTIGALDGNKDLSRLGAVLSIGGALAGGFGGTGSAESAAGSEAAASGAAESGAGAGDAFASADAAAGLDPAFGSTEAYNAAVATPEAAPALGAASTSNTTSLYDQAAASQAASGGETAASLYSTPEATAYPELGGNANLAGINSTSAVQQGAAGVDSQSFSSWLDRAMAKMGDTGRSAAQWIEKNPTQTKLVGDAVNGMWGPQAQAMRMQQSQMDYQRGLIERARANLNSPVALRYTPRS